MGRTIMVTREEKAAPWISRALAVQSSREPCTKIAPVLGTISMQPNVVRLRPKSRVVMPTTERKVVVSSKEVAARRAPPPVERPEARIIRPEQFVRAATRAEEADAAALSLQGPVIAVGILGGPGTEISMRTADMTVGPRADITDFEVNLDAGVY
jgi:hypothetical protein